MATRQEFANAMIEVYKNHGVYIGTANGEPTLSIAGKFFEMEKAYGRRDSSGNPLWWSDTARDYEYLAKCYRNNYDMSKSLAGDCSGIIVGILRKLGVIKPTEDYRAKDFQKISEPVHIKNLIIGDLVFDKATNAGHVGTYTGNGMVVDSRGRDVGVVYRSIDDYAWAVGGRLPWLTDDIPPLTRNLYYRSGDLMQGEDVKQCQERLIIKGFDPGEPDGVFGNHTKNAVVGFQARYSLEMDGIVGQKTWAKLWE